MGDPNAIFRPGFYTDMPVEKLAKLHPAMAKRAHYLLEPAGCRWRMTIRGFGQDRLAFYETGGEANRARQVLTNVGITGLVIGDLK